MSIQDIILSETFKDLHEYGKDFDEEQSHHAWDNAEQILQDWGLPLPPFMTFPEPPPLYTVRWDPDGAVFYADGQDFPDNPSLSDLYDQINRAGGDVLFDEVSLSEAPDVRGKRGMLFYGNRVLTGWLDPRPYAANAYWQFLTIARRYLRDPKDFHSAFYFMDKHPMFWYQTEHGSWVDEYGHSTLSTDVFMVDGKVRIGLEGGSTVPRTTHHYHDYKLDVYADTFEEAYIAFAAKIHQHHDLDGTDRKATE